MLLEPNATNETCQSIIACEALPILAGGLVIFAWWFFAKTVSGVYKNDYDHNKRTE